MDNDDCQGDTRMEVQEDGHLSLISKGHGDISLSPRLTVTFQLLQLLRIKQWLKNLFVLGPLLFSGKFLDFASGQKAFAAMLLFCLASSATYIVNDLKDVEYDKLHPRKSRTRPLASGTVTQKQAIILLIILYSMLFLGLFKYQHIILPIAVYIILNLFYCFWLKHQLIADISSISISFVLRVYTGALAIQVVLSSWMFITTFFLALYIAGIKRYQELRSYGNNGRKILRNYSERLLIWIIKISATGTLIFYTLYVITVNRKMILTIPVVILGLFRYWLLVEVDDGGETPAELLFSDQPLIASIFIWIALSMHAVWPH